MNVTVRIERGAWPFEETIPETDVELYIRNLKHLHPTLFKEGVKGQITKDGEVTPLDMTKYLGK